MSAKIKTKPATLHGLTFDIFFEQLLRKGKFRFLGGVLASAGLENVDN